MSSKSRSRAFSTVSRLICYVCEAQASKLFLRNMESSSLCSDSSVFSVQVPPLPPHSP